MTHIAKKRFGQNFLDDEYVIHQIINVINPKIDDFLVEIGPGLGALTKPLLNVVKKLHVIEIDRDIVSFLQKNFSNNLVVHLSDALKFDFKFNGISDSNNKIRVVGNLPYNISTPLLFHLANFDNIYDMHFMLQNEVVERICASSNNSAYGRLSIMLQYRFDCYKMLDVDSSAFTPKPKVDSAIIYLKPKSRNLWQNIDGKKLNQIVTKAFGQRRKTISNSLKGMVSKETLNTLAIDDKKRAENLTVEDYINLAKLS